MPRIILAFGIPMLSRRSFGVRALTVALPLKEWEHGFTLIELLVVLAILGLLVAL